MTTFIDTHTHLDGEEFATDRPEVIARAKAAGVGSVFIPAIDVKSVATVLDVCHQYPGYAYPMIGLHPEKTGQTSSTRCRRCSTPTATASRSL